VGRRSLGYEGAPPYEQRIAAAIAMVMAGATRSAACAEHGIWRATLKRRLAKIEGVPPARTGRPPAPAPKWIEQARDFVRSISATDGS
jgi:hypothetical protein